MSAEFPAKAASRSSTTAGQPGPSRPLCAGRPQQPSRIRRRVADSSAPASPAVPSPDEISTRLLGEVRVGVGYHPSRGSSASLPVEETGRMLQPGQSGTERVSSWFSGRRSQAQQRHRQGQPGDAQRRALRPPAQPDGPSSSSAVEVLWRSPRRCWAPHAQPRHRAGTRTGSRECRRFAGENAGAAERSARDTVDCRPCCGWPEPQADQDNSGVSGRRHQARRGGARTARRESSSVLSGSSNLKKFPQMRR